MPRVKITLRDCLLDTSSLLSDVREGASAIRSSDIKLIAESERDKIADSIDLDSAMREEHPNLHRWDYIASVPVVDKLVAIEPHSATDSEVAVVIAKKKSAQEYLKTHFNKGHKVSNWYWVSHGRVGFSKMDKARRQLDQHGIEFVGHFVREFK